ncbi:MAG: phosphoribosylanthranilate isomerase [Henriciella sp.]
MTGVKICGLRDTSHVRIAAEAGADWIGFVLYEPSPRNILASGPHALEPLVDLAEFAQGLGTACVALMVDPHPELVESVAALGLLNAIQLHGCETPDQVGHLRRLAGGRCEMWKALRIKDEDDLEALGAWPVDRLLLDAAPSVSSTIPGGNGEPFDWGLLDGVEMPGPWLLAGGLTPDNVVAAIAATGAPAVDVSSGVERVRGVKDEDLIRAFIDAVKLA